MPFPPEELNRLPMQRLMDLLRPPTEEERQKAYTFGLKIRESCEFTFGELEKLAEDVMLNLDASGEYALLHHIRATYPKTLSAVAEGLEPGVGEWLSV